MNAIIGKLAENADPALADYDAMSEVYMSEHPTATQVGNVAGQLPYMALGLGEVGGVNSLDEGLTSEEASNVGLSQSKIDEILSTPKGQRPDPSTYLSGEYINSHLSDFENGVTKIMPQEPKGTVGPIGGGFVMSKIQADELIAQSNGDISKLEELLGFNKGYLGDNPVRVDISSPSGLRMPSGNELGANAYWKPGGYTSGDIKEAVIDPAPKGTYIVNDVK